MNDTRIEVDLLGERKVPNDCYYGVHTLRALENFTISRGCMNDEPDFIRGMVFVKKASALTNKELGALPGDVADAIVAACDAILDEGRCMDQFPTDSFQGGAGTPWSLGGAVHVSVPHPLPPRRRRTPGHTRRAPGVSPLPACPPMNAARIAGGTSTRPSRAGNPAAHTHSPSSQNS